MSRTTQFFLGKLALTTALALPILSLVAIESQAALSEPHAIYYGEVIVNNQPLNAGDTNHSIIAKYNGEILDTFAMGTAPAGLGNQYVLRLPMDSYSTRTTGHARTGDTIAFYASHQGSEEFLASTTVGERGSVTLLKLGMVDIDGDTIDDAIDNCALHVNPSQQDTDSDGAGDACDDFPDNATETTDSDSDGMGDNFENANGFNPLNPADAALDADGDGTSNLAEFLAGSNPRDVILEPVNEDVPLPLWALILLALALGKLGASRRT